MDLGSRVISLLGKENVVHLFLAGAFVVLGVRSSTQQDEIDALEVEKESLRRSNKAMQKVMWDWRQAVFHLVESDPATSPISLAKLRTIFGDEDAAAAAAATSPAGATTAFVAAPPTSQNPGETTTRDSALPPRFTV